MTTTAAPPSIIGAQGIGKRYGRVQALDGVDLTVGRGEIVAVLGPNGAGKTTLIEIMLGLRLPDEGGVTLFDGRPDGPGVSARVGAMLQDTDVPQLLTVAEVIDLVRSYYPWALPRAEILRRADLTAKARARASQLSGGQRQRLSFAMAIAGDPDVLFLDEPTAALDVHARRAFWQQMRDFADLGKTLLFSSHNFDEVTALADRVVVVRAGRVIADDTPARITARFTATEVQLTTDAEPAFLQALPGVQEVREADRDLVGAADDVLSQANDGGRAGGADAGASRPVTLVTTCPEADLEALFASGHTVGDLIVAKADLESAFVALTDAPDATPAPITFGRTA